MVFSPDDVQFNLWDDGYDCMYKTPYGNIFTRRCELEDCDLFNVLKAEKAVGY